MIASEFSPYERQLLYQGLIALIEAGSGLGFANQDLRHPAYMLGAHNSESGATQDADMWGDSAERNHLYNLLRTLSVGIESECRPLVGNWSDFCRLATEAGAKKLQG